jgi:hypothetical protein
MNNTQTVPKERNMEFLRNVQARDWVIGVAAFIAGAWIF